METGIFEEFTQQLSNEIVRKLVTHFQELNLPSKSLERKKIEYLTREEVATLCKVKSLSTLWSWKQKGLLVPTSRAGRKPLYHKTDVIQFLEGKKGGNDV